ncbi:hypothetical protein ACV566_08700 [Staphylococcus aureus]
MFKVLDNGQHLELVTLSKVVVNSQDILDIASSDDLLVCAHEQGDSVSNCFRKK